jgi:TonB family protein
MILLSAVLHGLLFLILVVSSLAWPRKQTPPPIHHVELVRLPQGEVQEPQIVPQKEPKAVIPKPQVVKQVPREVKKVVKPAMPSIEKKPVKKETAVKETESPVKEKSPVLEKPPSSQPDKSKEASITPGVPDVMPMLERPYTEYEFYHALIGREIRKRWAPPPGSLRGQRMETIVAFSISRSGKVDRGVTIEKTSGNPFYDQAALRATLGTLPPPPPGYPEELLKMRLIYVLDQSHLN